MMKKLLALIAAPLLACPVLVLAQEPYPSKPIRMVVGYAPGGGTDVMARLISARMTELMGQTVFVENKPGNSGILAASQVAKSPADGYTVMMGVVSLNAIQPSLTPNLPFDPIKDFTPVTLTASVPHFIVVNPSLAVNSVKELIAHAKANPGKLSYPSAGNGTTPHIAGELFASMAGIAMVHVPYKSTGQSMPDLLAGRLEVGFDTLPTTATHVKSGKLRALAVTSARRLADFPTVPTVEEAGVPGYRFSTWYGVFAPGGTPPAVVNKLHAEIAKALQNNETRVKFAEMGVDDTVTRTPDEFAALVRGDIAKFAKVVKDAGIKLE
jgi:tripartite-type tricarboxylate transporter receptor subunit TctC